MQLPIVRLQIQEWPLKHGDKPYRWYDVSPIRQVDRLVVSDDGAVGRINGGGSDLVDVHHVRHPESRNHGRASGLSIGFTSHYRAMREQFGEHVTDGVAGENVLVDANRRMTAADLAGGSLRTSDGRDVPIDEVHVAEPCVEFSRFVLQVPHGEAGAAMREPLQQLRGGVRGFYVALAEPVELTVGDHLIVPS
jgi:hypothetical protein